MKLKEIIAKVWNWKPFRVFIWNVFNASVAYLGTYLLLPEYANYSVFLIPVLNWITKYVNTKWFNDLGVNKEQTNI
jgi:hypothetical protein